MTRAYVIAAIREYASRAAFLLALFALVALFGWLGRVDLSRIVTTLEWIR
jgi:hypothetical protein